MSAANKEKGPAKQGGRSPAAGGPRTPEGKAIAARNATTHGFFCRQTVLPHLGEDPEGYRTLLATLIDQIKPRNLIEMQYLELWASASWKLRRLSRLEAELWEQPDRAPAERLAEIDKLARLQSRLCRQMDKSLRMLGHDVPDLLQRRAREETLLRQSATEAQCARDPRVAEIIERMARRESCQNAFPDLHRELLDNSAAETSTPPAADETVAPNKKSENELPVTCATDSLSSPAATIAPGLPPTRSRHCHWPFSQSSGGKEAKPDRGLNMP